MDAGRRGSGNYYSSRTARDLRKGRNVFYQGKPCRPSSPLARGQGPKKNCHPNRGIFLWCCNVCVMSSLATSAHGLKVFSFQVLMSIAQHIKHKKRMKKAKFMVERDKD